MAYYLNNISTNLSSYLTPLKPVAGKQSKGPQINKRGQETDQPDHVQFDEGWLSSTKTIDFAALDQSTPTVVAPPAKRAHSPSARKARKIRKTSPDSGTLEDSSKETLEREILHDVLEDSEYLASSDEDDEQTTNKRRKTEHEYTLVDEADSDVELEGSTLIASPEHIQRARQAYRTMLNRKRMPPPPTPERTDVVSYTPDPKLVDKNLSRVHKILRKDVEDPDISDEELLSTRNQVKKTDRREVAYDFDLERARRFATAIELPKNSGHWSEAEKEIFFRLAMRGFEPLIPGNWKIDFKTLPESLFSVEGGEDPVIDPYSLRHFRASYFLSALLALGMRVRDRRIMQLRSEPVIRNTLRRFISWAFHDAEVHPTQRPNAIPIHAVLAMRPGEKSHQAIDRMTRKLHRLASRYHDFYSTYPSVETKSDDSVTISHEDDIRFPVLTGLLICSSVVLIVTLPSDPFHFHPRLPRPSAPTSETEPQSPKDESSRVRFIATFDFSDFGMDVWNGLAIAIVVMIIRKTMRKMMQQQQQDSDDSALWKSADDADETLIGGKDEEEEEVDA